MISQYPKIYMHTCIPHASHSTLNIQFVMIWTVLHIYFMFMELPLRDLKYLHISWETSTLQFNFSPHMITQYTEQSQFKDLTAALAHGKLV